MTIPDQKTTETSCACCRAYERSRVGGHCVYEPRGKQRSPSAQCAFFPSRFKKKFKE